MGSRVNTAMNIEEGLSRHQRSAPMYVREAVKSERAVCSGRVQALVAQHALCTKKSEIPEMWTCRCRWIPVSRGYRMQEMCSGASLEPWGGEISHAE